MNASEDPAPEGAGEASAQGGPTQASAAPGAGADASRGAVDRFDDAMSARGQSARGLYFSGLRVQYLGAERVVETLREARLDAAVIDLKDGAGQVTYPTGIEALRPQVEPYIEDPAGLFATLRRRDVYSIARIVCFSDPSLPRREPARAVLDDRPGHEGQLWANWEGRNTWLDPYNPENHALVVELAREAESLGADEIQLDYFRFPVDEAASFARFPAADGRPRHAVLADLLRRIDGAVHIPIGVDIFGAAAFRFRDVSALGQLVEHWLPHVDVLSPMLYLNGMRSFIPGQERRAERLVRLGVSRLRERVGDRVVIRPFLQAFPQGAEDYGPDFIANQIRGAVTGQGDGWLFWHPNSDYDTVRDGMRGPVQRLYFVPRRLGERRRAWARAQGAR